jgi:uncharacterized protein with HEPN domain
MEDQSAEPRLVDIVGAIERIESATKDLALDEFKATWERQWLVERGIEIISEANRSLPDEVKARHPEIPWKDVAAIGNILRHEYQRVVADVLWKVVRNDLTPLDAACRAELAIVRRRH